MIKGQVALIINIYYTILYNLVLLLPVDFLLYYRCQSQYVGNVLLR